MKIKILYLMTLMLLMSTILLACASEKEQVQKGEESENNISDSAPVKISIFAHGDTDSNIEDNSFTKLAEEMFNIDFDWQIVPNDGAKEKRQLSLASGDYPDLFMLIPWVDKFSQTDLLRFGKQGVIIPLNDLINSHAPNIKKAMEKHPYFEKMITAPDGNIYGLTQLIECYHCSFPNKMWINSEFLKKVNMEMPKTLEEFKNVMKAFKTQDPNGNGKADEIPLSGANGVGGRKIIPFFMNGFIYNDDKTYLLLKDGKIDIAANKPEWKEGLLFVKSMYDDGLIDPGAFTQNAEAFKNVGDNAAAEILGTGAAQHPYAFVTGTTDRAKHYDPLPPLVGPYAQQATYSYPSDSSATFVLTNKSSKEAQIAAIKLVDYMFTEEGQIRAHFGEKDQDWEEPGPDDEGLGGAVPILKTITRPAGSEPTNSSWGAMAQYYQPKEFRDSWAANKDMYEQEGYERRLHEATQQYEPYQPEEVFPHWAIWINPEMADEAAMLRQNIIDYIDQNSLQFVTGSKNIDKDWDAYIKGFDGLNLNRYLEIMQQSYETTY